jgi:hypothetical protein
MDQLTLARVNVFALLRCLEELPAHDEEARKVTAGKAETVQLSVGGMGKARLVVGDGRIQFLPGPGRCSILLWFPRPENLNAMFAGTGNPIPLKGLTKLSWLKGPFTRLTDRLSFYLKTTPERLQDPAYRTANAALSLCAAAYAVVEVGNNDRYGKLNAARMADGELRMAAAGGPDLGLIVEGGRLRCRRGASPRPRARMEFVDLESAGAMLRGELDSYTAIGQERLVLGGYVPLLDNLNKILGLVPRYLR